MRLLILLVLIILSISTIAAPLNGTQVEEEKEAGFLGMITSFISQKLEDWSGGFEKALEIDEMLETPEGRGELVDRALTAIDSELSSLRK